MKKSILLALLALALPASAGSIDWQLNTMGTANYMVDQNGNKLTGTAYLVLTDAYTSSTVSTIDDITGLALGGDGLAISDGVNKTVKTTTDARITPVDGTTDLSFTVLVYDSVNNAFFASDKKSQVAYNLTGEELTDARQVSFTAAQLYATSKTRGTQTYHPLVAPSVPEPSSAALALAGLALLLKRRRA